MSRVQSFDFGNGDESLTIPVDEFGRHRPQLEYPRIHPLPGEYVVFPHGAFYLPYYLLLDMQPKNIDREIIYDLLKASTERNRSAYTGGGGYNTGIEYEVVRRTYESLKIVKNAEGNQIGRLVFPFEKMRWKLVGVPFFLSTLLRINGTLSDHGMCFYIPPPTLLLPVFNDIVAFAQEDRFRKSQQDDDEQSQLIKAITRKAIDSIGHMQDESFVDDIRRQYLNSFFYIVS